jgi:hypothetical protein
MKRLTILCLVVSLQVAVPHAAYLQNPASISRQTEAPTEYQVKAAYLFNFLKFVEWPEDASADPHIRWTIGVVGDSPFGDDLAQFVLGKTVQGHLLDVKSFKTGEDTHVCRILFISKSEKKRLAPLISNLKGLPILTVADMDGFLESGGMIQFLMEDNRVRVSIDVGIASRAGLKVSSKLLSLALKVSGIEFGAPNQ